MYLQLKSLFIKALPAWRWAFPGTKKLPPGMHLLGWACRTRAMVPGTRGDQRCTKPQLLLPPRAYGTSQAGPLLLAECEQCHRTSVLGQATLWSWWTKLYNHVCVPVKREQTQTTKHPLSLFWLMWVMAFLYQGRLWHSCGLPSFQTRVVKTPKVRMNSLLLPAAANSEQNSASLNLSPNHLTQPTIFKKRK